MTELKGNWTAWDCVLFKATEFKILLQTAIFKIFSLHKKRKIYLDTPANTIEPVILLINK